jgi:hypothetical protein
MPKPCSAANRDRRVPPPRAVLGRPNVDLASCAPPPTPAARARLPPTASYLQRAGCIKLASPLTGGISSAQRCPHRETARSEGRRHPSRRAEGTSSLSPGGGEQGRLSPWRPDFASIAEQIDDDADSQLGHGVDRSLGR